MKAHTKRNLATVASVGIMLVTIFPVYWVVLTSMKTRTQIFTTPPVFFFQPDFSSYKAFLSTGPQSILGLLANSVIISLCTVGTTILCAGLASYAFSRYRFRFRFSLLMVILGTRLLPPIVSLIPIYLSFNRLGLIDTRTGLVIIYTALNLPFGTWLLKSYMDSIPVELEESGRVDGCTQLQSIVHILMPLVAPGLVAVAIFVFRSAWNEFMFAFIFSSTRARTLPIRIAETVGEMGIYWTDMATLAVILMVPALIFSFFMQKNLVKGLTAGALK